MKVIRVYRKPDCPKCARYARWHERLDWLDRVQTSTSTPHAHAPLHMGEVVVEDLRNGRVLEGAEGFHLLARQVPAYWPLLAVLPIPAVCGAIDREMRGACDDSCELRS